MPAAPPSRRARLPRRHQIQLFLQMQMLLSSGVLIADALRRLRDRYPDALTRRLLGEIHAQVAASRATLSQALARFPRSFPPGAVALVEAGEEGGAPALAERFGDLAERLAYEDATRRQLRRACAYPCFVVLLAIGLYLLLLAVVFPRLADLLGSLGGQLPPLTRAVIGASAWARRAWPLVAGPAAAAPLLWFWLRRIPSLGLALDRLFLHLPVIGATYRELSVALICKTFRSLYRANQPAPQILGLCVPLVGNRVFRRGLAEIRRRMAAEGATLAQAFDRSGLFPPMACLAIDVGEQSGQIAPCLDRVAAFLQNRARERLDAAVAVINPALTLAVVAGVGVMLMAFFQAAYEVVYVTR